MPTEMIHLCCIDRIKFVYACAHSHAPHCNVEATNAHANYNAWCWAGLSWCAPLHNIPWRTCQFNVSDPRTSL